MLIRTVPGNNLTKRPREIQHHTLTDEAANEEGDDLAGHEEQHEDGELPAAEVLDYRALHPGALRRRRRHRRQPLLCP